MNRKEAIKRILLENEDSHFVFSNGLTSREALAFYDNGKAFYMLHAMGEAFSVGLGLASAMPDKKIVVVEGDGNALMGCSSWSMNTFDNIKLYILDNGVYKTTGGQEIPKINTHENFIELIDIEDSEFVTPNPKHPKKIIEQFIAGL